MLLQWGRGHVTAESDKHKFIPTVLDELQWGRGHVTAESMRLAPYNAASAVLQWGRGHVTAESPPLDPVPSGALIASMRPRSRDRGIPANSRLHRHCLPCFNGAAVT